MTPQGLTSNEMIKWMDSIIKANDTQISFMWLHFQKHIKNRLKAREESFSAHHHVYDENCDVCNRILEQKNNNSGKK